MKHLISLIAVLSSFVAHAQVSKRSDETLHVIELRNYSVVKGQRERFQQFMERVIIPKQESQGGYVLQQYNLDGSDTSYVWIRGFHNMPSRSQFLKDFYSSDYWKQHRDETNSMLTNIEYIYLLKPLFVVGTKIDSTSGISRSQWVLKKGIAVIDFYATGGKRQPLIDLFIKECLPVLKKSGTDDYQLWISEMGNNDFWLPSIQDPNLLVNIRFFKDEVTFRKVQAMMDSDDALAKKIKDLAPSAWRQVVIH